MRGDGIDSPRLWIGVGLLVTGLVWTGQGLGWIPGSFMTGVTLWAMIGPLVAGAGVWLILAARRRDRGGDGPGHPRP